MTDKEKLEKIRSEVIWYIHLRNEGIIIGSCGDFEKLLKFIDSLQEEPVSEDLEEEIGRYFKENGDKWAYTDVARHFAKWQKEQMMAKAVEMVVGYWMPNGLMLTVDETENCYNIDEGDRVKVIVIKED